MSSAIAARSRGEFTSVWSRSKTQRRTAPSGYPCYDGSVTMTRRLSRVAAFLTLVLAAPSVPRALALDESERLWLVGEHAFADGLYVLARRELERFVDRNSGDERVPAALLMLGKARLALGEA